MALATFQALVGEFGGRLGVPEMAADGDGYLALSFDDVELHLQHDPEDDEVVVFTRLGEVEVDRAAEIYGMLLGANLFWQGTNGSTFSIDPDAGLVFLANRRAIAGLTVDQFNDWLQTFLDTATYWKKRLHSANAGGPLLDVEASEGDGGNDEGPSSPAGPNFMLRI